MIDQKTVLFALECLFHDEVFYSDLYFKTLLKFLYKINLKIEYYKVDIFSKLFKNLFLIFQIEDQDCLDEEILSNLIYIILFNKQTLQHEQKYIDLVLKEDQY